MALCVTSRLFLNTSRDGDSTTSLGRWFHCPVTLSVKNFFLTSNLNFPWRTLRLSSCSVSGCDVVCHWTCLSCDGIEMCSFCLEFLGVDCVFMKEFSQSCSQFAAFSQNWFCSPSGWHFPSRTTSVVLSLLKGPWGIFRGNFTLHFLSFGYCYSKIAVLNCSWFSTLK